MSEGQAAPLLNIHVDDVGMCHGANRAFFALSRAGRCDSGSVMVPCPWFSEVADEAARDTTLDIGVHLTLTAEKTHYRWRPLTGSSRTSGLVDRDGYFWRSVAEVRQHADPEAVDAELRAQIDAAFEAGIDVTHLDDHMGAVFAPEFCEIYVQLGHDYNLPILFPRSMSAYGPIHNLNGPLDDALHRRLGAKLEASGVLLVDRVLETPWHRNQAVEERYQPLFEAVRGGFTVMALHPNESGDVEAIEPTSAAIRIEEYELLASPFGGRRLDEIPAHRITMRALRDELRTVRGALRRSGT